MVNTEANTFVVGDRVREADGNRRGIVTAVSGAGVEVQWEAKKNEVSQARMVYRSWELRRA